MPNSIVSGGPSARRLGHGGPAGDCQPTARAAGRRRSDRGPRRPDARRLGPGPASPPPAGLARRAAGGSGRRPASLPARAGGPRRTPRRGPSQPDPAPGRGPPACQRGRPAGARDRGQDRPRRPASAAGPSRPARDARPATRTQPLAPTAACRAASARQACPRICGSHGRARRPCRRPGIRPGRSRHGRSPPRCRAAGNAAARPMTQTGDRRHWRAQAATARPRRRRRRGGVMDEHGDGPDRGQRAELAARRPRRPGRALPAGRDPVPGRAGRRRLAGPEPRGRGASVRARRRRAEPGHGARASTSASARSGRPSSSWSRRSCSSPRPVTAAAWPCSARRAPTLASSPTRWRCWSSAPGRTWRRSPGSRPPRYQAE